MEVVLALLALASLPYLVVVGGLVGFAVDENGVGPLLTAPFAAPAEDEVWCERLDLARGHERYPVFVPPTDPRSEVTQDVDVLACRRPIIRSGTRDPLAAAVLQDLDDRAKALTALAVPQEARPARVYVQAFTPDLALSRKVAEAARSALAARGLAVQRQAPLPVAADAELLRTRSTAEAVDLSCRRLFREGQLGDDDLWVALAVVDPLATSLHVGACFRGRFTWLQ
ncbi:MAG: hypothetical protein FJ137_17020 [Deltaproteobacteria bacterium]|nr:hypothetical protein [Deltaproteobacteria bacterium]